MHLRMTDGGSAGLVLSLHPDRSPWVSAPKPGEPHAEGFSKRRWIRKSWTRFVPRQVAARYWAKKAFKEGIEKTDGAAALVVGLAALYQREGKIDLTIEQYESFLARNPDADAAANNLAMLLVDRDSDSDRSRTRDFAQRLKDSDNPAFLDTAGWVYYMHGEPDEAVPLLERAVAEAPEQATSLYHLGMAHKAQGKTELARLHLEKALEKDVRFEGEEDSRAALKALTKG